MFPKVVNGTGAGESFNLHCDERIEILQVDNGWARFRASSGQEGYASMWFISDAQPGSKEHVRQSRDQAGQVTVQVVGSQQGSWQQNTQVAPGQPATAETNCTGIDPVNCKTVWHPATAPTVMTQNIHEVWVNAIIGERHVRLWCQKYFRDCRDLEAGSYTGEVKGDSVYLDTFNLGGKKKRIKYKVVGSW